MLATQAAGRTLVHDWMYELRLFALEQMSGMGADLFLADAHRIIVTGPTKLRGGRTLDSRDLRSGMSLIAAGLAAEGQTRVAPLETVERGYSQLVDRLNGAWRESREGRVILRMTRSLLTLGTIVALSAALPAQSPEPPLADTRLTVHTLVREDIFAGFLQNDVSRLARAEKNIDALLASRPNDRANLLAWQGSTALTRAVMANDARQPDQFRQHYRRALALYAEAMRLGPDVVGVFAIVGGTQASLADRLPAEERAAGWQQAYSAYQQLWKLQGAAIEKLPLHHKGEVLAGLAQSAQRTGRNDEVTVTSIGCWRSFLIRHTRSVRSNGRTTQRPARRRS